MQMETLGNPFFSWPGTVIGSGRPADPSGPGAKDKSRGGDAEGEKSRTKILIVDDDPLACDVLSRNLNNRGFQTVSVANGKLALEALAEGGYHLVLMDLHMPEMDGLLATREIRAGCQDPTIPIIGISSDNRDESRRKANLVQMDELLIKPIFKETLFQAVETWLNKGRPDGN